MRTIIFLLSMLISQLLISQNQWNLIYYENLDYYFKNVQYLNSSDAWAVSQGGVIAHSNNGGEDWDIQYEKPGYSFGGVHFVNNQTGYVVDWSEVCKTNNGGEDWIFQNLPNPLGLDVESVFFINPDTGWIAGSYKTIYHTTNGGNTWTSQHSYELQDHYWLLDIQFYDELHGCAVGDKLFMPYHGIIFTTDDGGETWTETIFEDSEGFKKVEYISQDTLWAASNDGKLFKSTDGGISWSVFQQIHDHLTDLQFFNSNEAYAISYSHFFSSTYNGWETWETIDLGYANSFNKFSFLDHFNGIGIDNADILKTSNGGNDWHSVFDHFTKISFFDTENGWLVDHYIPKQMYHSNDGGFSWDLFDAGNEGNIIDLDFISEQTGFAISDSSELLKTIDSGNSWEIINIPFDSMYYSNIQFIDNENGFLITGNSRFMKTEDGGETWYSYTFDTINFLRSCFFLDASNGWITGSQGLCAHTTNGGLNWDIQSFDTYYLTDIYFFNLEKGFAISYIGELFETTDGGENWEETELFDNQLINIKFVDDTNGWLVGLCKIYHTENGGYTWEEEFDLTTSGYNQSISSFSALSSDDAWFCSSSGKIFSYGLQTGISEETRIELRIFPNPANYILNIDAQFNSKNRIIEIYSIEGRFILRKEIEQWTNPVQLNISSLKAGIYILKIKGEKGVYKWIKN